MKYTVHGASMVNWQMQFESDEKLPTRVWNAAAEATRDADIDHRVMEQSQRIVAIHPADRRCTLCPPEPKIIDPTKAKPVQPSKESGVFK